MTWEDLVASGMVRGEVACAGMTTYKLGGQVAWYAHVMTRNDLDVLLAARNSADDAMPIFVLGRGSNVVISDRGFGGLVIKLGGEFNEVVITGDVVTAGAGVSLPRLARTCAAAGRGGLEFFVGIPGSVGGAVVMNAGGHGADTAAQLIDARVLDIETGRISVDDPADLDLSYRHSRIGPSDVVLGARFHTVEREPGEAEQIMRGITMWRRENQPGGTFNAGSVFKNPSGDAAGRLIDMTGLKGLRRGGVAVSTRHANFFVADDSACAQDLYDLVAEVRRLVAVATGIDLQPEIRFIGEFGDPR